MKKHSISIHRLVDRAEQLGKHIQDQLYEFVLCHSDIHGGNVLMDGNNIIYMVDWDDPMMAFFILQHSLFSINICRLLITSIS